MNVCIHVGGVPSRKVDRRASYTCSVTERTSQLASITTSRTKMVSNKVLAPLDQLCYVCVLFFAASEDQGGYTGTFDQFLKEWLSGGIPFGSWAGHLREWLAAAEDPENSDSILLVRYEDMKRDLAGAVRRVARFLQCSLSESDIDSIIPKVRHHHHYAFPEFAASKCVCACAHLNGLIVTGYI